MMTPIFAEPLSTDPWWWEAAPGQACEPDGLPASVDVAIIGAGFTGLSAALELAKAGREVLVLDAGVPGEGASKRNGGMIGSGHRVGYAALEKKYDKRAAVALLKEGLEALAYTTDLIGREAIECQFQRCGRFRGAWRPEHYEAFGREVDLLKRVIGLEAHMVPRSEQHQEIATDAYHGGCVYPEHGGLHPGLFHQGLLDRAMGAGAKVAGMTPVTRLDQEASGFRLETARGTVMAGNVIVATNGYSGPVTPWVRRRLIPVASFIIATEPLADGEVQQLFPTSRMIVESRLRHCYFRPSPDGRRILFGGRADLVPTDLRQSAAVLRRLMLAVFPDLTDLKISHSWSGFVAFSRDHLPHLGAHEGLHYALGYSGSGVAMAPYLGYRIANRVLGTAEGLSPFDKTPFPAIPFYNGTPWFLPIVERYYRWRERSEA